MAPAVSPSSCDDSCHDSRAASSRMPCCWLVRVSDGRSESTAAPLPGPAGPVLRWSLPTPSGKLPKGVPQRRSQPWDERARVGKDQTPEYTPNLTLPSLNQAGRGVLGQGQSRGKESCPIPLRGDQKTLPWGRQPHSAPLPAQGPSSARSVSADTTPEKPAPGSLAGLCLLPADLPTGQCPCWAGVPALPHSPVCSERPFLECIPRIIVVSWWSVLTGLCPYHSLGT